MSVETLPVTDKRGYQMLDAWRGIASIWVVLAHASLSIGELFRDMLHSPLFVFCISGRLGVQMFFVISGYCIANAAGSALRHNHGLAEFLRARAKRIYPAYWLALVLYSVLAVVTAWLVSSGRLKSSVLGSHDPLHNGWLYPITNALLIQAPFHLPNIILTSWTLCYEIFFYGIVGLGLLLWRHKGEAGMLNALHGLTAASLLLLIVAPQYRFFPLDMWPQFGLGILVYDWLKHSEQRRPKQWALALALLVVVFVLRWDILIGTLQEPGRLTYAVALGYAAILLWLHRYDEALSQNVLIKKLSGVGLFSYSLYLMHIICLGLLSQIAKRMHLPHSLAYVWLALSLILAVAVGRIFYHFCERPFLKGNRAAKLEPPPEGKKAIAVGMSDGK